MGREEQGHTKNNEASGEKEVRIKRIGNHDLYIDLTSHNIPFTTLNIMIKDESAYVLFEC